MDEWLLIGYGMALATALASGLVSIPVVLAAAPAAVPAMAPAATLVATPAVAEWLEFGLLFVVGLGRGLECGVSEEGVSCV